MICILEEGDQITPTSTQKRGSLRNYNLVRRLVDLTILSRGKPYSAFSLAIIFLSLAGIPPLLGFLGK